MMTQTFRGRTLDEARRAAHAALGPEAAVLTTRKVPRLGLGGLFGARDVEIAVAPPPASEPPPAASARRGIFSAAAYGAEAGKAAAPADLTALRAELRSELRSIHGASARPPSVDLSIESEITALRVAVERFTEPEAPRTGALGRILRETGLEGKAALALAKALKKEGRAPSPEALRDAVADLIRAAPSPLNAEGPALVALVGPAGVGKTTTAGKLAAHAIHELSRTVTIISCDGVRVGAFEQIERFAELLGVTLVCARSAGELARAVAAATTDLVIVDTPGRSPRDLDSAERSLGASSLATRGKTPRSRSVLLCLPASLRADDAAHFARAFAPTRPTALAITKLDETRTPAGLVHGTAATSLPVSLLCFGQRVPEDIAPATSGAMLDYLLPKASTRQRNR
jgi:flagellar biosynthesis protein FlhF